jgi:hypothetical protein
MGQYSLVVFEVGTANRLLRLDAAMFDMVQAVLGEQHRLPRIS